MNASNIMDIDGNVLEGGGQILRVAVAFSVLLKIPIRIFNIRAKRSKPGLSPQHLKGLELIRDITGGKLSGGQLRSTEIVFHPGQLKPGSFLVDTGTAGSIALLLQMIIPCALFSGGTTYLELRGGTNADMAPQIDYTTTVFLNLLKKFAASFTYDLILRGFFPKGGGKLKVTISPVQKLYSVDLTEPGIVNKIWGSAFTGGNCPFNVSKQMGQAAENYLRSAVPGVNPCIEQVNEPLERAVGGTASGINVFAETTTGCLLGGSALSNRQLKPQLVGQKAAEELAESIRTRVCLDSYAQDQVIILMALAEGKSRILCGPITLHTRTVMYVAQLMSDAKFTIEKDKDDRNIIECHGIGLENKNFS